MTRPARDIITRARRRRVRHGVAAAAAAAVIAVVVALTLLPGSGGHGPSPVRLAAWNVATRPGGKLIVTIRELRDPAGLQRRLRADGVPATVRFTSQNPRLCLYYPLSSRRAFRLLARIFPQNSSTRAQTAFTINPAAIPARIAPWITVSAARTQHGPRSTEFSASWTLVYASGHCHAGRRPKGYSGGGVVGG